MIHRLPSLLLWTGLCGVVSLAGGCAKSEPPAPPKEEASAPKPPRASTEEFWTSEQLVYLREKFGELESTPGTGLFHKVLQPGTGDERPGRANLVTVHYRGTFLDDRVFDDSRLKGRPFQFRVGVGHVIKGWDLAVADMRKGEKRLVVVPYWLGYGASGRIPTIMPRATLVFEIELLDWQSTAKVPGTPPS